MKAVITGATRGIGKEIAKSLATQGYHLVLLARSEKALISFAAELKKNGVDVDVLAIDLAKSDFQKEILAADHFFENTTVLINNLGVYEVDSPSDLTLENLTNQLQVNLLSAVGLTQRVTEKAQLTNIINIGSVMSIEASEMATSYSISKHAFKGWNDALRENYRSKKITVTAIYPGAVNTSSWDNLEVDRSQMIQPEDISNCVELILKMNPNTVLEEIRLSPRDFKQ